MKNKKARSKIFNPNFLKKNRKGELTTEQIVVLIVLIISFAVLLFLLFRLDLFKNNQQEVCHNSVVTRGSSIVPTKGVPLQCEREYSCITTDRSCEKMTKPEKYEVEDKEEVYQVLADMMADCWWMYGEGRINYVGKDGLPKLYCSFCNQVAFDDSIKEIFPQGEFDKVEFYQYLAVNNMSNLDQTYAEYLFETNEIWKIHSGDFGKIYTDRTYYVLMGITSDINKIGWAVAGGVIAGGIALAPFTFGGSTGLVWGAVIAAGGAGLGAAGASGTNYFLAPVVAGDSGNDYISPSLIEANSQAFEDLGCKEIASLS